MSSEGWRVGESHETLAFDGDAVILAVPGAEGEVVRVGSGDGPVMISAHEAGELQLATLSFGFPAVAEAVASPDSLAMCTMLTTPASGVWDGVPLRPGMTFVYPAGATHHAADPAGLEFAMVVVPMEALERAASDLGVDLAIESGPAASKRVFDDDSWTSMLTSALAGDRATPWGDRAMGLEDALVDGIVHALADEEGSDMPNGHRRGLSDADLVWETREFLAASGSWIVPVLSLCRHLSVSERRLQMAFHRVFGVGPHAFMRYRAIQAAHRALVEARDSTTTTVAEVARLHGISHPGRFARSYLDVYGELPSVTLNGALR